MPLNCLHVNKYSGRLWNHVGLLFANDFSCQDSVCRCLDTGLGLLSNTFIGTEIALAVAAAV